MFDRIKRLYDENKLDAEAVGNAVKKGWISKEECKMITGTDYQEKSE